MEDKVKSYPYIFFLALLLLINYLFFKLIEPLILVCFWAIILALLFYPVYSRLVPKLNGRKNLATILTIILILIIVVIPIVLLTVAVVDQTTLLLMKGREAGIDREYVEEFVRSWIPQGEIYLERLGVDLEKFNENFRSSLIQAGRYLAERAFYFTQNLLIVIVEFFLMLYLLYFFLRDGKEIIKKVIDTIPIGNQTEEYLMNKFYNVTFATAKGSLIIAALQGTLGGLLFYFIGIPASVLWGLLMAVFSLIPFGGAGVIWVPACVLLAFQGEWMEVVIIVIVGVLIIGLVDNILRPVLVSRDTHMPDYVILISTLGGIVWFGIAGFILGPVIAAMFMACWDVAGRLFKVN